MNKKLTIITATYNSESYLVDLLKSLEKQTYKNFSVIFVDNQSSDNSVGFLESYKGDLDIMCIKNKKNMGFAKANNVGVNIALEKGADVVLLLNDDTIVEDKTIENCLEYLFKDKSIGAIVPTILHWKPNQQYVWWVGTKLRTLKDMIKARTIKPAYHEHKNTKLTQIKNLVSREVDLLTGCALFVKANVIKKVGLLDERYFMYFEDADRSLRIKEEGYTLHHNTNGLVYHNTPMKKKQGNRTTGLKKKVRYIISLVRFMLLHYTK